MDLLSWALLVFSLGFFLGHTVCFFGISKTLAKAKRILKDDIERLKNELN